MNWISDDRLKIDGPVESDITVVVCTSDDRKQFTYSIAGNSDDIPLTHVDHQIEDGKSIEEALAMLRKYLANLERWVSSKVDQNFDPKELDHTIVARASELFELLIPSEIRDILVEKAIPNKRLRSLHIISDQRYSSNIPWELMFYSRGSDSIHSDDFLGLRFSVSRWFLNQPTFGPHAEIDELKVFYGNEQYRNDLQSIETDVKENFMVKGEEISFSALVTGFNRAQCINHVSAHTEMDYDEPADPGILMSGSVPDRFGLLDLNVIEFGRDSFVVMNTCIANSNWAYAMIRNGLWGYVGTTQKLDELSAGIFSRVFYRELLLKQRSASNALRCARESIFKAMKPENRMSYYSRFLAFSYIYFGQPNFKLIRVNVDLKKI